MTQGAIDLAQAELSTPVESAILLVQNELHLGPRLLAAQPAPTKALVPQTIANYTWWDSQTSVYISIPISAGISAGKLIPGQVQCDIQQQQLQCTITSGTAHPVIQHRLCISHLHAAIQPGLSSCQLDGQPVRLERALPTSGSQTHCVALQSVQDTNSCALLPQHRKPSPQAHHSPTASCQQAPAWCLHSPMVSHLQRLTPRSAAAAAASASQVLITLAKADPSQVWEKLTRPLPPCQPCKLAPASEQSMAALRRSLMQQRQQAQAQQGRPMASTAAGSGLPAADSTEAAMARDECVLQPSILMASTDVRIDGKPGTLAAASPGADGTIAAQKTRPGGVEVRRTAHACLW